MDWAAQNGHLSVVGWLHANRSEGCYKNAIHLAAAYGKMSVVRWLECQANRLRNAPHGSENIYQLFASEGFIADAMDCAAKNGHIFFFFYVLSHNHCLLAGRLDI
mmetsp:Transcript_10561/g.18651  ORF Transcript_10561/g.18651 Transcript_10561/m.18651 type:complete len:105 (+) Transcript_10561:219-533(+)